MFTEYLANVEVFFKQDCVKYVGWEKNVKGKFCPKFVDLSKTMDPKKLVYLNIFKT